MSSLNLTIYYMNKAEFMYLTKMFKLHRKHTAAHFYVE